MVNYDLLFMAQGAIDTLYAKEIQKCYDENSKTLLMPLCFMLFGLNLSLNSPTIYHHEGDLFMYPLYEPWWAQNFHVLGSYYYVYFLTWYMKTISNEVFNKAVYDYVVGGSMMAYITHYLWIIMMVGTIVRPFKLEFTEAVFVTYIGTELSIFIFHYSLRFVLRQMKGKK